MLNAIGVEFGGCRYDETYTAPAWSFPDIPGASTAANALVASSYALLQDCAEMLTAAQRYQGAVLAGDTAAQATQDAAFNAAFQQYSQDRVSLSTAIDAFLLGVADVTFEADTTFAEDTNLYRDQTDPGNSFGPMTDPVVAAWISALTSAFPGVSTPGSFFSGEPTVITDDVNYALEQLDLATPGSQTGSVQAAITGISNTLSIENFDPVISVTESGDLPLVEAGIDSIGRHGRRHDDAQLCRSQLAIGMATRRSFAKYGWTLVSGTTYSKAGVYGTATFNIVSGQVTYTLNNNDPDTQALAAAGGDRTVRRHRVRRERRLRYGRPPNRHRGDQ